MVPWATVMDTGAVGATSSAPNCGEAVTTATGLAGALLAELDPDDASVAAAPAGEASPAWPATWVIVPPPVPPEQAARAVNRPPRASVIAIRPNAVRWVVIWSSEHFCGSTSAGCGRCT